MKWEAILLEVKKIRGKSNGLLFDRVKLLVDVFNDGDFLAFHGGDMDKAEAQLTGELGDFGIDFFDAKAMFELFPKRSQWEQGTIKQMLADAIEHNDAARKARGESAKPRKTRDAVSKKDLAAAVDAAKKAEQRSGFLADELQAARTKIEELLVENKQLTAELARAEGRISELERFVKREPVVA